MSAHLHLSILPSPTTSPTTPSTPTLPPDDGNENTPDTADYLPHDIGTDIGDFDDDGYLDLAVGVPFEDLEPIENAGSVRILDGSATGLTANGEGWNQDSGGIPGAAEEGDLFGLALAAGSWCGEKHWIYIPLIY